MQKLVDRADEALVVGVANPFDFCLTVCRVLCQGLQELLTLTSLAGVFDCW